MMEWLTTLAVAYPKLFIAAGRVLFSIVGLFALLGLRLDRIGSKIERVSSRVGIASPDTMAAFPWWLRLLIPESFGGWLYLVIWICLAVCLVRLGKWGKTMGQ